MAAPDLPASESQTKTAGLALVFGPPLNSGGPVVTWTLVASPGSLPPSASIDASSGVVTVPA